MRFAVVSQYYPPEPVPLPASVAHGLAERGHEVRVLTALPSYPEGRLYAGYPPVRTDDTDGGVAVRRVPIHFDHGDRAVGRIRNYLSFGRAAAAEADWVRGVDAVYVYATQMTAATAPARWQRRNGTPYVLHVQDLWPDAVVGSGLLGPVGSLAAAATRPWLGGLYRRSSAVLAIAPGMTRELQARGVPHASTVLNWSPIEPARRAQGPGPATTVVYAGKLGELQDLATVVRAAALVRDLPDLRILIAGRGETEQALRRLRDELSADNVEFLGALERPQMEALYERSDFQLVTLRDTPAMRMTVPSKLSASFARGIPVICTAAGDAADIVEGAGAGLTGPSGDPGGLASTLRSAHGLTGPARERMSRAAHETYQTRMSMRAGLDRVEAALVSAAETRRAHP